MIDFEFHSPTTLDEALELLDKHGDDARVMAGGTALVMMMKQRLAQPGHVIGLRKVSGLAGISAASNGDAGGVRIGALCTQRQVETDPIVAEVAPLLSYAFSRVATPRIRNMGTIGGGLVHGDPNQDPPPALIALGASAVLSSKDGERVIPVEDLFIDYFETDVQPGEILTSVLVPPAPTGSGAVYLKFLPRTADDYATVSVAAIVEPGEGNTCNALKLVLGASGVTPIRAKAAEDLLRGQSLSDENIRACAAAVKDEVDPLDDFRGSADYKRDMAEVFARRAIEQALSTARGG